MVVVVVSVVTLISPMSCRDGDDALPIWVSGLLLVSSIPMAAGPPMERPLPPPPPSRNRDDDDDDASGDDAGVSFWLRHPLLK